MMKKLRVLSVILFGVWFALALPLDGFAATAVSWTATTKTAWDKLVSNADSVQASKLNALYGNLTGLQKSETRLDEQTTALHYSNAEALTVVNNSIKHIDEAKLNALSAQAKQTRDRYQPLLDNYKQLTQRVSAAKALKSKDLAKLLQMQADLLKPAVQAAKTEIKKRDDAYKDAKDAAAKKAKAIRATLDGIDTVNVKIRASKSSVTSSKSAMSPVSKVFTQTVKKGDAKSAATSLSGILTLYRQLNGHKEKIFGYEQNIAAIIAKAKTQLPA